MHLGGGTARALGGLVERATGSAAPDRGVSVTVGQIETAIDLTMAVDYGKPIPQIAEAVRRNVISRVEKLVGLNVKEVNITVNDVLLPTEPAPVVAADEPRVR